MMSNNQRDLPLNHIPIIWLLLREINCMAGLIFLSKFQKKHIAFHEIDDFKELYRIRETRLRGWQSALDYKLLDLAKEKGISLDQMKSIFYDYFFRKYPENQAINRINYWGLRHLKILAKYSTLGAAFIATMIPIYGFIDGIVEGNKIAQEQGIKQSWEILKTYKYEEGDLGRKEILEFLNKLQKEEKNFLAKVKNKLQNRSPKRRFALHGVNLDKAALPGINLKEAHLHFSSFKKTKLIGAVFDDANFYQADLSEAVLEDAKLNNAKLFNTNLSKTRFINAELNNAELDSAILNRANLDNAKLIDASLVRAELQWANLEKANLTGVDFSRAKLTGAKLTGVIFCSTDHKCQENITPNPNKTNLIFADVRNLSDQKNLDINELKKTQNWRAAIYDDKLRKDKLCGEVYFIETQKTDVVKQSIKFQEYIDKKKDLSCFNLTRKRDLGTDQLTPVNLSALNLTEVNFSGSDLTDISLKNADLKEANFEGANLNRANLEGARNLTPEQIKKARNWKLAKYEPKFREQLGLSPEERG